MALHIVFMLEELSMKRFLDSFLPRILPPNSGVTFRTVPHEGKQDLERSLPRKLRAWRTPDTVFVVLRDQDAADCVDVKNKLTTLRADADRPDTLVRIACRELEAWFLGDLEAVALAFDTPRIADLQRRSKFRTPDALGNPTQELQRLVPEYQKVSGASRLAEHIDVERCVSTSFGYFIKGLHRLIENHTDAGM